LLFGGGGALYRAFVERESFLEIALTVALLVLAFLLGDSVSTRRRLRAEVRERLRAAAVEKELEAQARVSGERVRIAQELHDVLAHTIITMTVQAGVAADLLSDRPEQARHSLATLRASGREAMAELRATIAVLRSGVEGPTRHAAPGLAQLDHLMRGVEEAGLPVDLEVRGERRDLPAAVELTAYRIVQEALTNVIRHARATRATVCVRVGRSAVEVIVEDDGAGRADAPAHHGSGLLGLTERARALGGVLSAGNRPGGGFRLQATLPAPEADR
jgi:signal transduction histidine kinase